MTALSADKPRIYGGDGDNSMPVKASTKIYEGAPVGDDGSGYARNLVAGDPFRGFAYRQADNSSGAAGDINVRLVTEGYIQLAISGLAITDVGKAVYASDSDTFTLTAGSNSFIGRVHRFVSSGVGIVEFDGDKATLGLITALTDSSGGSVDGTVAAVTNLSTSNTYTDAAVNAKLAIINDNFAELAAKINNLAQQLK